jgi:hypothetical protein
MVCVCKNGPHNSQVIGQVMKIAATLKKTSVQKHSLLWVVFPKISLKIIHIRKDRNNARTVCQICGEQVNLIFTCSLFLILQILFVKLPLFWHQGLVPSE